MSAKYAAKRIKSTGSIFLTNGIIGSRPQKGWVIAAGICGALEAVTRALAIELAPIRVNLVCAGIVRTELWRNMTEPERNGLFEKAGRALPVGRVAQMSPAWQGEGQLLKHPLKPAPVLTRVSKRLTMGRSAEGEIKHAYRLVLLRRVRPHASAARGELVQL